MRIRLTMPLTALLLLLFTLQSASQTNTRKISGTITSSAGEPLQGASVTIPNTRMGATTNFAGKFSITIPESTDSLAISSLGYISKKIGLNGRLVINTSLDEDNKSQLSQVVVIGYGTTRKSDLTGSVASVKADELKVIPATSLDQALQGRAAGVQVTQLSGKPGAEMSIRIRGTSSVNAGNEPLYVVDGLLINSDGGDLSYGGTLGPRIGPLASINPGDIESIEILKDASATAIYGARGANGVVLITTKKGKAGQGRVNFESYYGLQQVANQLKLLNAAQFATLVNEAKLNAGQTPVYVNPKNLGEGTDWQDEIYRQAPMASYQLSITGGDDKTKYAVTGAYFNQDGIILNTNFKRYSFRANLERQVNNKLFIGDNFSWSRIATTGVLTNAGTIVPGVVSAALLFNPVLPVYDTAVKGGYTYENDRGVVLGNPVAEAKHYNSITTLSRVLGNVYARYKLNDHLEFRSSLGLDAFTNRENSFGPNFLRRTQASKGEAVVSSSEGITWLNENTLTYNNQFGNDHVVNAVVGYTLQQFHNDKLIAFASDFPDDRTGFHNIAAGLRTQKPGNTESAWSMVSYLGRFNYTLKNKYLFTLTGRVDGSSKFGAGSKYGFFPSAAAAWRVSDEAFMSEIKAISELKLRASYGVIGNQAIPPYQSLALVGPYGEGVFNSSTGEEVYTGREPISYVNTGLKWESTRQLDLGFDLSLFNRRVSITADYYNKRTFDLLLSTPIPTTSGFGSTVLNVGNINNHGLDLDIRSTNITGKLSWNSIITFSVNRNKLTNLNTSTDVFLPGGLLLRTGESIGTFYGYIFDGIFQTDQEAASSAVLIGQEPSSSNPASRARAGDRKYRDLNGDHKIDAGDRTIIGIAQPKFTWGFNNSFSFKNFDCSVFIQGSQGNKLANLNSFDLLKFNGQNNVLAEAGLNRFRPDHPGNKYPRAVAAGSLDIGVFSTAIVEDASYIRLKNITLAYNIPVKAHIKTLKLYVSATNLWTHTNYSGYDPEANTYGQNTTLVGIDAGGYPQSKVYQVGISAGF